jgi:aerobic-type carbon monoxide dehydrogenase small subunit (CoxS/CutS family)
MRAEGRSVTFALNGVPTTIDVEVRTLLSDALRHEVKATGTHVGCEHGVCGACTIIVDGDPVRSCLMLAVQVDGREVETVESLGTPEQLNALQEAFRDNHGLQCGFCTPGILMSATVAEREGLSLDDTLHHVLGGHVCRCTGYQNIRASIEAYWSERRGS